MYSSPWLTHLGCVVNEVDSTPFPTILPVPILLGRYARWAGIISTRLVARQRYPMQFTVILPFSTQQDKDTIQESNAYEELKFMLSLLVTCKLQKLGRETDSTCSGAFTGTSISVRMKPTTCCCRDLYSQRLVEGLYQSVHSICRSLMGATMLAMSSKPGCRL